MAQDRYIMSVDLGTTAFKAALFDDAGAAVATHTEEHTLLTPHALIVEQTADAYWQTFKTSIRRVLEKSGAAKEKIAAMSFSAQGETMCFLDEAMQPQGNFLVWMDTRAQDEADDINRAFPSEEILQVTGQGPIASLYPASKVLWMRRHHPEILEKTKKILLLEDYIVFRLTGRTCGEGSLWCTSYLWNINTRRWWPEMLQMAGVRADQLPDIVPTGTPLGTILPGVAAELGLSPDTQLVMGALDQLCGAIGVGSIAPGVVSECTGAAVAVCTMSDHIVLDHGGELPCFFGAEPGRYLLHACGKGGIVYRWLRDQLCSELLSAEKAGGADAYAEMDKLAADIPAGCEGLTVLPFWGGAGGPDTDQYAKGCIYGLGLQHTRAHLIRAFMEAVAVNIYRMVKYTENITHSPITEIRALGGGANSPLWCQIKADMLGVPVKTMHNVQDAGCLAAAMIAGWGTGLWPGLEEKAAQVIRLDKTYLPNPANRAAYDELIARYDTLLAATKPVTRRL